MKKMNDVIIICIMVILIAVLFSSCDKENTLDPCYVVEQEIESQEKLIDRMVELQMNPNTDPEIWGQLRERLLEARAKLGRLVIERSEVCG
jgi:hypothetical protein